MGSKMIDTPSESKKNKTKTSLKSKHMIKEREKDNIFNVKTNKRMDPVNEKEKARQKWELMNIKKDHLLQLAQKKHEFRVI
jgi:hypothetical protein